jgi:hypothetical protein
MTHRTQFSPIRDTEEVKLSLYLVALVATGLSGIWATFVNPTVLRWTVCLSGFRLNFTCNTEILPVLLPSGNLRRQYHLVCTLSPVLVLIRRSNSYCEPFRVDSNTRCIFGLKQSQSQLFGATSFGTRLRFLSGQTTPHYSRKNQYTIDPKCSWIPRAGKHLDLRAKLTHFFSVSAGNKSKSFDELMIRSVTLYYLKHPTVHLGKLSKDNDTTVWIEKVLKRFPIFLVTGLIPHSYRGGSWTYSTTPIRSSINDWSFRKRRLFNWSHCDSSGCLRLRWFRPQGW